MSMSLLTAPIIFDVDALNDTCILALYFFLFCQSNTSMFFSEQELSSGTNLYAFELYTFPVGLFHVTSCLCVRSMSFSINKTKICLS